MVDAALSLVDVEGAYGGKPPASLNGFDLVWENGAAVQASLDLNVLDCAFYDWIVLDRQVHDELTAIL